MSTARHVVEYPVQYTYECHVAFVEVSSGVYAIGKSKDPFNYPKTEYYTSEDVVSAMNQIELRVLICQKTIDRPLYANFKLSTDKEEK